MSFVKTGLLQQAKVLWKKGWVEAPEIMSSHVLSAIGIIGICCIQYYSTKHTMVVKNFQTPLFLRPDDPRAKKTVTYYEEGWDRK